MTRHLGSPPKFSSRHRAAIPPSPRSEQPGDPVPSRENTVSEPQWHFKFP
ncbi:MAG: hypothetical protein AAGF75_13080 [Cyanobacteria bacterium P01_H01_bin.130]